ncbi:hypothetical protein DUI87_00309 [Hirundo rustica rustica]|uniref:Uncharacterized protein n=1 Tax=Hirundo rustica rustica TaxID=333673 RepID=A0A3M0LBA0_HIRRU|nr:hypothetical protein DUI87_00309 [Hirundo rustica rustica]
MRKGGAKRRRLPSNAAHARWCVPLLGNGGSIAVPLPEFPEFPNFSNPGGWKRHREKRHRESSRGFFPPGSSHDGMWDGAGMRGRGWDGIPGMLRVREVSKERWDEILGSWEVSVPVEWCLGLTVSGSRPEPSRDSGIQDAQDPSRGVFMEFGDGKGKGDPSWSAEIPRNSRNSFSRRNRDGAGSNPGEGFGIRAWNARTGNGSHRQRVGILWNFGILGRNSRPGWNSQRIPGSPAVSEGGFGSPWDGGKCPWDGIEGPWIPSQTIPGFWDPGRSGSIPRGFYGIRGWEREGRPFLEC